MVLKKGVHRTIEEKMSAGNNVSVLVGGIHSQGSFKNYVDIILLFLPPPPSETKSELVFGPNYMIFWHQE